MAMELTTAICHCLCGERERELEDVLQAVTSIPHERKRERPEYIVLFLDSKTLKYNYLGKNNL